MSKTQRWLALALILWGVPAFLLLFVAASVLRVQEGRAVEELFARLEERIFDLRDEGQPERYIARWLQEQLPVFDALPVSVTSSASAGSLTALLAWQQQAEASLPPGRVGLKVFDPAGRLIAPADDPDRDALELMIEWLRAPLDATRPYADEVAIMGSYFFQADELIRNLRGRPDQIVIRPPEGAGPTGVVFHERPRVAGSCGLVLLALFSVRDVPLAERCSAALTAERGEGSRLALVPPVGAPVVSQGWRSEQVRALGERLADRPLTRLDSDGWLVVGRSFEGLRLLAAEERPRSPTGLWSLVLGVWAAVGGFILLRLWRLVVAEAQLRMTLPVKLGGLLALGVGLPLLIAVPLAHLTLEEAWEESVARHRQVAEAELDRIDAGFEAELRQRELRLRTLCGEFASAPPDLGRLRRELGAIFAGFDIDKFAIIASDGQVLDFSEWDTPTSLLRWLRRPLSERRKQLVVAQARGWVPKEWGELPALLATHPEVFLPRLQRPRPNKSMVQLMEIMLQEVVSEAHIRRGLPAPRARGKNLLVSGLFGNEMGEVARTAVANLGRLRLVQGAFGNDFIFSQAIPDATGLPACLLFVTHKHNGLNEAYLSRVCGPLRAGAGLASGTQLMAVPYPGSMVPAFPQVEVAQAFAAIAERARRAPGEPVAQVWRAIGAGAGGAAASFSGLDGSGWDDPAGVDVVARVGHRLPASVLLLATPRSQLAAGLQSLRWRVGLLLVAALLFCGLATGATLLRLLPPLRELAQGLAAMRFKRFDRRLITVRRDELGRLFMAFNRTMMHLADMQLAATVQRRIFPQGDLVQGAFRVVGCNQMTQATGGDYLDHFRLPDGRVVVVLGDVTGHGIASALVTAMAKTALALLVPLAPDDPGSVLQCINQLFLDTLERKRAMSCMLGILAPETGVLQLVNAGQCYPLSLTPEGGSDYLTAPGSYPLGISARCRLTPVGVDLARSGSGLVLYSDGLIEASDDKGNQVGYDRFAAAVRAAVDEAPGAPGAALLRRIRAMTDPVPWADDASVLFLLRGPPVAATPASGPGKA